MQHIGPGLPIRDRNGAHVDAVSEVAERRFAGCSVATRTNLHDQRFKPCYVITYRWQSAVFQLLRIIG